MHNVQQINQVRYNEWEYRKEASITVSNIVELLLAENKKWSTQSFSPEDDLDYGINCALRRGPHFLRISVHKLATRQDFHTTLFQKLVFPFV